MPLKSLLPPLSETASQVSCLIAALNRLRGTPMHLARQERGVHKLVLEFLGVTYNNFEESMRVGETLLQEVVGHCCFHPTKNHFYCIAYQHLVRCSISEKHWRKMPETFRCSGWMYRVAVHAKLPVVAVCNSENNLWLLHMDTLTEIKSLYLGLEGIVGMICFHPRKPVLAVGIKQSLYFFTVPDLKRVSEIEVPSRSYWPVHNVNIGERLCVISKRREVFTLELDVNTGLPTTGILRTVPTQKFVGLYSVPNGFPIGSITNNSMDLFVFPFVHRLRVLQRYGAGKWKRVSYLENTIKGASSGRFHPHLPLLAVNRSVVEKSDVEVVCTRSGRSLFRNITYSHEYFMDKGKLIFHPRLPLLLFLRRGHPTVFKIPLTI